MNSKLKNSAILAVIIMSGLSVLNSLGCASLKEKARGFAGISTRPLEDARKDAISKTFNYDHKTCYAKAKSVLKEKGSYIYAEDAAGGMIAIYVSEIDTTPVGIYFSAINANSTRVEVSSPSTSAKELISSRIFSGLEAKQKP